MHSLTVKPQHERKFSATQPDGALCDRIEHRLNIGRGVGNHAQHFRRCSLLFQRLSQIVCALAGVIEQPGVLDSDDGLVSEALEERYLLLSERSQLLAIDAAAASQVACLEHRHKKEGAGASELVECFAGPLGNVPNMDNLSS